MHHSHDRCFCHGLSVRAVAAGCFRWCAFDSRDDRQFDQRCAVAARCVGAKLATAARIWRALAEDAASCGGFLVGCLLGACAVSWLEYWAWSLPIYWQEWRWYCGKRIPRMNSADGLASDSSGLTEKFKPVQVPTPEERGFQDDSQRGIPDTTPEIPRGSRLDLVLWTSDQKRATENPGSTHRQNRKTPEVSVCSNKRISDLLTRNQLSKLALASC